MYVFLFVSLTLPAVNCRETPSGGEFIGNITTTLTGRQCQGWQDVRHVVNITKEQFPENSLKHSYCRNPDSSPHGPWCVSSLNTREKCSIPFCGKYMFSV